MLKALHILAPRFIPKSASLCLYSSRYFSSMADNKNQFDIEISNQVHPFKLPSLPYAYDSLAPKISAKTLEFHHDKHHNAYVTKLNTLVEGQAQYKGKSLKEIIMSASGGVFNNAAQHYNHSFYWKCMIAKSPAVPPKLLDLINKKYSSFELFAKEFKDKGVNHFGSGWVWLVMNKETNSLDIVEGHDAGNPMKTSDKLVPLLAMDVWEHAYYLDTQNARPQYINNFFDIINWEFVASQLP